MVTASLANMIAAAKTGNDRGASAPINNGDPGSSPLVGGNVRVGCLRSLDAIEFIDPDDANDALTVLLIPDAGHSLIRTSDTWKRTPAP